MLGYIYLFELGFLFFSDIYPGMELLGNMVFYFFFFLRYPHTVFLLYCCASQLKESASERVSHLSKSQKTGDKAKAKMRSSGFLWSVLSTTSCCVFISLFFCLFSKLLCITFCTSVTMLIQK